MRKKHDYCYCGFSTYDEMVECSNPNCEKYWFHFDCASLEVTPPHDWTCLTCIKKTIKLNPSQ